MHIFNISTTSVHDFKMVWGGIGHSEKSLLIVVEGSMTAVKYRDVILRPVAAPLLQQRQLILQQDHARPHIARVYRDFVAKNNTVSPEWLPYLFVPYTAFVGRSGQKGKEASESSNHLHTIKKCFGG